MQSVLFTVIWRGLADRWKEDKQADRSSRSLSESSDRPPVDNSVEEEDIPMEEERF